MGTMTTPNHRSGHNNRTRRRPSGCPTAVIASAAALRQRSRTVVVLRLLLLLVVLAATATSASRSSSVIHQLQHTEEEEAFIDLNPHDDNGNEKLISDNHDNDNKSLTSSYQRHDGEDSIISSSANATTTVTSPSSTHRHLLLVDPKVRERFLADPPGYRKHPSYYSETYLRRAATSEYLTDEAATRLELQQQWGHWTFVDRKRTMRPGNDFYTQYPHRDVPRVDFPAEAWQSNVDYVQKFLNQATDLTMRAMEAILTEYGSGAPAPPDTTATYPRADFVQRSAAFQVDKTSVLDNKDYKTTGGWIPQESWNGLKRRLLHAIMTEDSFHLVMGGHSSAAGTLKINIECV
jgi:hypothetical protein